MNAELVSCLFCKEFGLIEDKGWTPSFWHNGIQYGGNLQDAVCPGCTKKFLIWDDKIGDMGLKPEAIPPEFAGSGFTLSSLQTLVCC